MSRRPREWTEKDVDLLTLGCRLGMPIDEVARQIKRGAQECLDKAAELRLHVTRQIGEGSF